ncbi:hypothetical protein A3D77_00660 [Candidatus Gottesmanbacteria bacterium RIFCSPHIGHO2_02_FULL_39_11]|uniref:Glycosyltransferase 2-like domain-containing protein n=1 Tax=Candidatus Gottesmanbacteria bacterium RIFCSPHIGHO2_02_FULL_39_11 TaxID=1798382 RepID=A0A1F5ZM90_9BACT|nr:MAG: hypothetical protein A3D77_00660 [Candidatus Gottesmanbacteria bacterium RIFCSPHIGHO2_02_FULL_39_11]
MSPFFSIIIPVLNEEEFIGRLLNNLVKQTEHDFEVYVVDGNSTDKTASIVKSYEHKLPVTFLTSNIQNVSIQRNKGAGRAQGKYLIFFDADVQIGPTFLSKLKSELENKKFLLVTTYVKADSKNIYDKAIAQVLNYTTEVSKRIEKPFIPGFNLIVYHSIFNLIGGFREDVVHAEDYEICQRLEKAGCKLTILKKPLLTFSLRRFRAEGRLNVLRKNAMATLHLFTKGPITKEIFSYPMGGEWYKSLENKHISRTTFDTFRKTILRFKRFITV